jgi:ankyrin repeat protein
MARGSGGGRGSGMLPLHWAASQGDAARLREMLRAKPALLNGGDDAHWTAFHLSCAGGHVDCAAVLVEAGCDTDLVNNDGLTGLQVAQKLHARSRTDQSLPRARLADILKLLH